MNDEMEDLTIPVIVKIAGGGCMMTGGFTLGLALQTSMIFRMKGSIVAVVALMAILGVAAVVTGWGTFRGRAGSSIAAAVTAGLVATLGSVWAIVGLLSGVLSPLSFGVVLFGTGAAVLTGLAIGPARKVTRARDGLRAQGLDFGV
jgi:hypothetical protein